MSKNTHSYPPNVPQDLSGYLPLTGGTITGGIVTRSIRSSTDFDALGAAAQYWGNFYAKTHYFNSTANINGLTPGQMKATGLFVPAQAPTVSAPGYVLGAMYFDTTLNKLRIGGASGWETVTSA